MTGRVEALWLKRAHRGPMDLVERATLVAGEGIAGDASFGRSRRQVTVIEKEAFDRIRAELPHADPIMRRANVMVSGIALEGARGRVLALGDVRILLHGETRPCERMDEACPGLRSALGRSWGGGAYGAVLDDGVVRVGAAARLEEPAAVGA